MTGLDPNHAVPNCLTTTNDLCNASPECLKGCTYSKFGDDDVASSNADKLVTVFGGSGFIGRHIVGSLAKRGYRVRVACRRPDLAGHAFFGVPGQIALVQANLRFPDSVAAACEGAFAVVNATGIDVSSGNQTFDAVVSFGTEAMAKAARATKAELFLMVSGLGAGAIPDSKAAVAKGQAEAAAAKAFPGAMILRPSVVFGSGDRFFNKIAGMARFSPVLPLIGGGTTPCQPVFVGDVAEAVARLIDNGQSTGKTYELGGPEVATMAEITQFTLDTVYRKRLLLPLPWSISKLLGSIAAWLPGAPITGDQVELLKAPNVVSEKAKAEKRDLAGLGISARSYRQIVPDYLYRFRKEGQFTLPSGTPK
jgi:uncharacterized protein YbjT (DUF2867 family)